MVGCNFSTDCRCERDSSCHRLWWRSACGRLCRTGRRTHRVQGHTLSQDTEIWQNGFTLPDGTRFQDAEYETPVRVSLAFRQEANHQHPKVQKPLQLINVVSEWRVPHQDIVITKLNQRHRNLHLDEIYDAQRSAGMRTCPS